MTAPLVYNSTRYPLLTLPVSERALQNGTAAAARMETAGQLWWRLDEYQATRELRAKLAVYEALLDAAGIER